MTDKPTLDRPFVTSDSGALSAALLVVPPLGIDRLRPIHGESSPIPDRARLQHEILLRLLADRNVRTVVLDSESDAPTAAFAGDCAVVLENGAVLMRPSAMERRAEVARIERALLEAGIPIVGRIEAPGLLDGGDIALGAGTAWIGVPRGAGQTPRSNELGRRQFAELARAAGLKAVEIGLSAAVLRLRNVLSFVADDTVLAAPDHLDVAALERLTTIAVPRGEEYGAGVLALAPRRVVANLRFREAIPAMRRAKIAVEAIDLWEFGKAGAGPFSLVVALKRG